MRRSMTTYLTSVAMWIVVISAAAQEAESSDRQNHFDRVPLKLNQCVGTKIEAISDRFGGNDPKSGTSIRYTNGVLGISYERVTNVFESAAVGDVVLLCLIEKGTCPDPGNDRARAYKATDRRTGVRLPRVYRSPR